VPALLVRSVQVLALLVAAALAVVGALALRGPGLVTVLVAAVLVGAISAGMASEAAGAGRGRVLDTGGRAAGWTAGVLLVLAGLAAVAGAVVTLLVAGAVATAVLTVQLRRAGARSRNEARPVLRPLSSAPLRPVRLEAPVSSRPSVGGLSARALGEEWLRSTALLEARIDPALRRSVVDRRESILDELERRDGSGFARWLAEGPTSSSNPADHVRDLPAAGSGAP
jgi:hypothetical protein